MLTLDFLFYIILKYFVGAAMIGGNEAAPDCKSGTLKRCWFEPSSNHLTSLIISGIVDKFQLIHADIAQ